MAPSAAGQNSPIWIYFTKSGSNEENAIATCNTCNDAMKSDPASTSRLSNHLKVFHKPLHSELEEIQRMFMNVGGSSSTKAPMKKKGLLVLNENVPAGHGKSPLRQFRKNKLELECDALRAKQTNFRISSLQGVAAATVATPCTVLQTSNKKESARKKKQKKSQVITFKGCLLALTGTHDCAVDHEQGIIPQKEINHEARVSNGGSLREFRISRNQSKGTYYCVSKSWMPSGFSLGSTSPNGVWCLNP